MFNTYEFTFAGQSSFMFGMVVCDVDGKGQSDVSFGNKASIIETRVLRRIRPVHYGVNYHEDPLEFTLVFGSETPKDRYEMEEIAMWLTGHQTYQWMSICQPDMEHLQFRCLITELTPISHGWLPVAFQATVRCDCPYAYSYPFEVTYRFTNGDTLNFHNDSSVREYLRPIVTITPDENCRNFSVTNNSDNGRVSAFTNAPASGLIAYMDNENGILFAVSEDGSVNDEYNLYQFFNLNFIRLVPGDNELTFTGSGTITFSGRFLHNVAG